MTGGEARRAWLQQQERVASSVNMQMPRPAADTASDLVIGTLLAETLEQADFGVFVYDDEGRYIAVNRRGAQILGGDRDDVMKHNVGDFTGDGIDRRVLYSQEVRQGVRQIRRKDGSDVTVGFVVGPTDVGRLPHRVAIVWELPPGQRVVDNS